MLSMHSCREVLAVADLPLMIAALGRTLEADVPPPTA
jgi:aspartyl aminopeptidase